MGVNRSVYFNISTAAGNEIQATVKRKAYKRDYGATGSPRTQVTPVAPIRTNGVLLVIDVSTGEKLEQPWTWIFLGGGAGWLSRLWKNVRGLFTRE